MPRERGKEHQGNHPLHSPLYRPAFRDELNAILGKKEARRAEPLKQLTRKMTEESYDVYSIIELVHAGLTAATNREYRRDGEAILRHVETYLAGHDILTKSLLPEKEVAFESGNMGELPDATHFEKARQLYGDLDRLQAMYAARTRERTDAFTYDGSEIQHLVRGSARAVEGTAEDAGRSMVFNRSGRTHMVSERLKFADILGTPVGERLQLEEEEMSIQESLNRRRSMAEKGFEMALSKERTLLCPEEMLEIGLNQSYKMGEFDFTRKQYGGVSLQDILTPGDRRERAMKIMRFVGHLPKGDLFWRQVKQQIFFMPQAIQANTVFRHPDWSEAIYLAQLDIADGLLTPGIAEAAGTPVIPDGEFLDEAGEMLSGMDRGVFTYFALSLYNAAKITPFSYMQIHPDVSMNEFTRSVPLYQVSLNAYVRDNIPQGRQAQIVFIDEALHYCFGQYRDGLIDSWRGIAPQARVDQFSQIMADLTRQSYTEVHTEGIMETLRKRLGTTFWEKLNRFALAELDAVQAEMIKAFTTREMMGFWPTGEDIHSVAFSGDKLPALLGLDSISFLTPKVDEAYGKEIQFIMQLSDPKISIRGELPVDFLGGSEEMKLSVDLSAHPGLRSIMRSIVIATFHDLVLRNRLLKMRTAGRPEESGERPRPKRVRKGAPEEGRRSQELPRRGHSILDEPYIELEELHQQIDAGISATVRDYKPKTIDPHPLALRGAHRYQYMVERYLARLAVQDAGEAREVDLQVLRDQVREARADMYNISEEKRNMLGSLPPSFRGEIRSIPDPLSEEHEPIFLTTWVSDYKKPKPAADIIASPQAMYEKFYKTGPQTRFLDVFTVWLWGD